MSIRPMTNRDTNPIPGRRPALPRRTQSDAKARPRRGCPTRGRPLPTRGMSHFLPSNRLDQHACHVLRPQTCQRASPGLCTSHRGARDGRRQLRFAFAFSRLSRYDGDTVRRIQKERTPKVEEHGQPIHCFPRTSCAKRSERFPTHAARAADRSQFQNSPHEGPTEAADPLGGGLICRIGQGDG
jgi:hypothetical protein